MCKATTRFKDKFQPTLSITKENRKFRTNMCVLNKGTVPTYMRPTKQLNSVNCPVNSTPNVTKKSTEFIGHAKKDRKQCYLFRDKNFDSEIYISAR